MILDCLENWKQYAALNGGFAEAFEFLRRRDLAELPEGKHPIDGDRVFAIIVRADGVGHDKARLEIHKKYIDIQFCITGCDEIGWRPTDCCSGDEGFDEDKDLGFFTDAAEAWVSVTPGRFAIYFPADAHAPLGGDGPVHKVVVKIAEE